MATTTARLQAAVALVALLVAAAAAKAAPSVYVQIGADVPAAIARRTLRGLSRALPSSFCLLTRPRTVYPAPATGPQACRSSWRRRRRGRW